MQYSGMIGASGVVWHRFLDERNKRGLFSACVLIGVLALRVILSPVFTVLRSHKTFRFEGRDYAYFCHWYNTTFSNERAVEIALAKRALEKSNNGRILEIGNVLTHYLPHQHDVLDKYEKGEGVIHQDVVDFRPAAPYDLIVSISTIEHVGYDEEPQDPQKIAKAVSVLRSCLAPGGQLLVTIPVGYNPHADVLLRQGLFPRQYYLRRMGRKNTWVQTTKEDAFRAKFNEPYVFGNALVIGMADSPRRS